MPDTAPESSSADVAAHELSGWERLRHSLRRPTRGQIVVTLSLALVGYGIAAQIHTVQSDDAFSSMRRTDLISLLETLDSQSTKLENEVNQLTNTRDQLRSGVDRAQVAQTEAKSRLDSLQVLAGTVPVSGPGIRMTIGDPNHQLRAATLIDALQEMRDAGAEVIEFNDSIRVVAQTWVADDGGSLVVDGHTLTRPVIMDVIGDPQTLEQAARFRGGLVSQVESDAVRGTVDISQEQDVEITSLHAYQAPTYAKPA